jgi:ABC-type phosphate/phosphonate transport system substrate-binding protein
MSKVHGGGGRHLLDAGSRLVQALSRRSGLEVALTVLNDYDHQLSAVLAGGLDIAWLPPLLHARATAEGARLVAVPERGGFITCRAAVLVRADSPARTTADLKSPRAAWITRLSATGHIFPRIDLAAHGVGFSSETFYDAPARCFTAVSMGHADLCAAFVSSTAEEVGRAQQEVIALYGSPVEKLRVLHVTDLIPPDGMVLAAATSIDDEHALRGALLSLHEDAEGLRAIGDLLRAERLVGVTDGLRRMLRSWTELALARNAP